MIKKYGLIIVILISFMFSSLVIFSTEQAHAKAKNYSITPTTKPINKTFIKNKNYNSSTKQYYLLRSYLEEIEKNGGGTLRLKKGTYTISNVLYIPSNTKLKLDNGVVIKKGTTTGKASFSASNSLFQLIDPKKSKKSIGKYNGGKNIQIIGAGNATIDMNNASKAHGLIVGHNQRVSISGIHFKRNNASSFIHIISSVDVKIEKNKFTDANALTKLPAIRMESAVNSSAVYKTSWNKLDGTINMKINITNNQFTNQYNAIKTTGVVKGKFQKHIKVNKNKFSRIKRETIYMSAWMKPELNKNNFDDRFESSAQTILARAVKFPTIRDNHFISTTNIIRFETLAEENSVNISDESELKSPHFENEMTLANKRDLSINKIEDLKNYKVDLPNGEYGITGDTLEFNNENELEKETYTFNSESKSLNLSYTFRPSYTKLTKDYYVLRSIMEQLEKQGGGTLFIEKGDYSLTNTLYVPSNVTIELEDGAVLRKALVTDASTMNLSASIFQFVPPSKSDGKGILGNYDGTKNVKIFSKGTATLDLQNKFFSFAIIMAHAENIHIENIDFINMNSGHFIELNSSKKVTILNCTFKDSIASEDYMKEAINIDTPDIETKGFNLAWSKLDRTPTEDVSIQHSKFENLDRAIGTHKYSGDGVSKGVTYISRPHKNVEIFNNTFKNTRNDAIRIMNWDRPKIVNNTFENIGQGDIGKRGILASGVIFPLIENNHFENMGRPMQFFPWKNNLNGAFYNIIYNELDNMSLESFANNTGSNLHEYFIRISSEYLIYTNPQKINIKQNIIEEDI